MTHDYSFPPWLARELAGRLGQSIVSVAQPNDISLRPCFSKSNWLGPQPLRQRSRSLLGRRRGAESHDFNLVSRVVKRRSKSASQVPGTDQGDGRATLSAFSCHGFGG